MKLSGGEQEQKINKQKTKKKKKMEGGSKNIIFSFAFPEAFSADSHLQIFIIVKQKCFS